MKLRSKPAGSRPAFTLVELLVVIVIVAVLAALAFSISRSVMASAEKASCLNRVRQFGSVLLSRATEENNQIRVFKGGGGSFDLRPYHIMRLELNLPEQPEEAHYESLKDIMFCPTSPAPNLPHWNSYGVNVNSNDVSGAQWNTENIKDANGRSGNVSTLRTAAVRRPSSCILAADSCRSDGQEIFRIFKGDLIGLRHGGKANVFFLDGSARNLGPSELGKLGIDRAFDTSDNPPASVSLPRS